MKTVPKNTLENDRRRLLRSIKKLENELHPKKPVFLLGVIFIEEQLKIEKEILEYSKKFPLAIKKKNLPVVWCLLAETKRNLTPKYTIEEAMKEVHLKASKNSLNNLRRKTERLMDKAWALTHADFSREELRRIKMGVKVTKGGRGPIGSRVKAPGGRFVHERQTNPKKYSTCRTITQKDGTEIRVCKIKGSKKWEKQSVLRPIRRP